MEKVRYSGLAIRALLVTVLTLASVLAFALYHIIASPRTSTYGISGDVNISVQVEPASCSPPRIDDIKPMTGSVKGGTDITITGDNLNCVDAVFISNAFRCEPIAHINNQELKCTMPPHVEGYVDVTVVSPGYSESIKDNGFRYLGDGDSGLPLPPNTGLFRLGNQIITLYELLAIITTMVLFAGVLWFVALKRSRRRKADKTA